MKKSIFNSTITIIFSCILLACGGGGTTTPSSPTNAGINNVNLTESNLTLTPDLNKPKVKIDIISHAWYTESPNEYETGESFTIKATLENSATITTENKIKLVTSNTGLIYESDECTIDNAGNCSINVTIAESANLGESYLAIQSNTDLVGTTELTFKVVAGNIIFYTFNKLKEGDFAINSTGQSVNQVVDAWCQSYAESEGWPGFSQMSDRYKKKSYKGMILGNPATISGKVYYRFDAQTKVAVATDDYLAESLENSIWKTGSENPLANTAPISVWTGTIQNNSGGTPKNCSNWTSKSVQNSAGIGELETQTKSDRKWFKSGRSMNCSRELGIYCVSQPNIQAN